ncbi:hypothetical protein GCM10009809_17070 [Isoptericola hypogeus]|uniref:Superfamily IV 4 TMS phage holin n=1 Tax=Isoptericola hypogeus TaxID=300179 RepID=A0ABN2JBQ7_9MICO
MIRFLIRTAIFLLAAAVGLLLTDWIFGAFDLETFDINWSEPLGFIIAVVVFALAQAILSPFLAKVARNNAPALVGAVGLLSTFVALIIAVLTTDGLAVSGAAGWILGPIVVWLVGMLAAFLLPLFLLKEGVEKVRENND